MAAHPLQSKRILLFGKTGQLGTELVGLLSGTCELMALGREEVDCEKSEAIRAAMQEFQPTIVINAAGYTAVDDAERHPDVAERLNANAPGILAEEAARIGALLVHYSTDYVFDGVEDRAYVEEDESHPLNIYGLTKLAGERAIQQTGCQHFIFRVTWLYAPHGKNFYRTVLRLALERPQLRIVNDQFGSPTSAWEVARATVATLEKVNAPSTAELSGIYHMTGPGRVTWCEFAKKILELARPDSETEIVGISGEEYGAAAKRPRNSVLNSDKLRGTFGIELPSWEEQLARVVVRDESRVKVHK